MKQALTGGAYQAHSVIASAQRSLNLYAEPLPETQGEPMPAAHYPTPGLRLLGTIGTGPIRGIRQCTTGGTYVVSGSTVYSVDTSSWVGSALGTITAGIHTPVSMDDNGLDMLIVDGSANGWDVTLASNSMAPVSDPTGMFSGADRVDYLDTYFILNKPATPQFYISGSLAVTFDPLDFANKEAYSDLLVVAVVAKRLIYLFGTKTTEIWYDAGTTFSSTDPTAATSFQFAAMQSEVFIDHGCAAKYSPAVYDNSVFWLTKDRQGQGIVMMVSGYQTKRVSTYAIEAEIAGYSRIDDAIGFTYQLAGHSFYVLTFPQQDHTWSYDISTGHWHEWLWIDSNGDEHRHRANCFWPVNGALVVGDWQNGNLYALDRDVFTDNGQPIKRVRSFPHMLADGKRVFYRQFLADMDVGNPGAPPTTTTSIQQIITWPPQIASVTGPPTGTGARIAVDWQRGSAYFTDLNTYSKYAAQLTTQSTPIATGTTNGLLPDILALDPLSGDLLEQRGTTNAEPVVKLNPNTFAALASFGVATSTPSYPTSVWIGESIVCVVCNGVSYGLLKYSAFSGVVSAFRVDTMQHAGFSQTVVSGSTNNRGIMCPGASGGSTASAFLTWRNLQFSATIPLYVVTITAGAETYNPAAWPTTNSHISSATAGTIATSAIDPSQPNLSPNSIGYDLADGNVILHVSTGTTTGVHYYIAKVRASDAAVLWTVPVSAAVHVAFEQSRINGSVWVFDGSFTTGTSTRIDTLTGQVTTQPLNYVFDNLPGYPATDSENAFALFYGQFTAGSGSPVAVSGTTNFTNGWGVMGGDTKVTTVTTAQAAGNLISLEWSDDRGHSYGNPVTQPLGAPGEYRTSLQWQRLSYARDRVFRLSWAVPKRTALQGAWIDATPAQS